MTENRKAGLRHLLDQPFVGFTPWILLSVVEGPGRVVIASALACALALALAGAGALAGGRPKLLDVTAIAFFGAMTAVAALAGHGTQHWLDLWAGEVSNIAIALITFGSIAVGRPFTLAYARETTDRAYWDSPLFLRINYVISTVWAIVFLLTAAVGYIGDGPLHQPNNIWTGWIIQIALLILAIKFTGWYPDHATAEPPAEPSAALAAANLPADPSAAAEPPADPPAAAEPPANPSAATAHKPTPLALLRPLAAYLVPAGILAMIFDGGSWWIGAVLIVLGISASRWLRRSATLGSSPRRS